MMILSVWIVPCLLACNGVQGFVVSNQIPRKTAFQTASTTPTRPAVTTEHKIPQRTSRLYASQKDNEDESSSSQWDDWNPIRDEQSQMPDYIASFLNNNNNNNNNNNDDPPPTHMIGIPMDHNHDLLLELESVQRAILYHCPVLVHACIAPAMTRMPLLYVSARDKASATVTRTLHELVERIVQQRVYKKQEMPQATVVMDPDEEDEVMCGVNPDGYQPLILNFENLEIDGKGNEVLHTVAVQDGGSEQLNDLVLELKLEIEALGWKVSFPPDEHGGDTTLSFRPRVPFMRLPENFESLLEPLQDDEEDWMRTSDQGGNGISPIFWCQWWEDTFGSNVRMREVSIYPRQPGKTGMGEEAFYIPHETTYLPNGNEALTKVEQRHEAYNDERMAQAEGRVVESNDDRVEQDGSIQYPQVARQREQLESIYAANDVDDIDADVKQEIEQSLEAINDVEESATQPSSSDDPIVSSDKDKETSQAEIDDWTRERIRKTVEARAFVQAQKVEQKDKPSIEDNPVFQKYRDGTLVAKKKSDASNSTATKQELPDYPSREHFFGIWRVIQSPTGWPEQVGDDNKSDNLILRVDGTISGGPTLDQETNQKASGGTWKMLDPTDDAGTKLRIRLVIPPKKERILVMEGEVTRFTSDTAADLPLSRSTFGIPELEAAAQKREQDSEDLMHCGGPVWIEDAVTGKNRQEIGEFSIMKLQSPLEPGKYTITIPRPVRSQD